MLLVFFAQCSLKKTFYRTKKNLQCEVKYCCTGTQRILELIVDLLLKDQQVVVHVIDPYEQCCGAGAGFFSWSRSR